MLAKQTVDEMIEEMDTTEQKYLKQSLSKELVAAIADQIMETQSLVQ